MPILLNDIGHDFGVAHEPVSLSALEVFEDFFSLLLAAEVDIGSFPPHCPEKS